MMLSFIMELQRTGLKKENFPYSIWVFSLLCHIDHWFSSTVC